jgi:SAM-dependent methyltransferase
MRCRGCGLVFIDPQPDDAALSAIYGPDYHIGTGDARQDAAIVDMKRHGARLTLDILKRHVPPGARLFELGCGRGHFLAEAQAAGFDVFGADIAPDSVAAAAALVGPGRVRCGVPEELDLPEAGHDDCYDACVLLDVIEHLRNPLDTLTRLRRCLRPGGKIVMVTPSLDSLSARLLGSRWVEFKDEHLFCFSEHAMRSALVLTGFSVRELGGARKALSPEYVLLHFVRFPLPGLGWAARAALGLLPQALLRQRFVVPAGGMFMVAEASRE